MIGIRLITLSLLLLGHIASYAQLEDNPTLQQWLFEDARYDDPQNGNPIFPGYYADPTIVEYEGTFYIYATSDLTSWDAITKLGVLSSTDLKNWSCTYLNWPTKDLCVSKTGRPDGVWAPSVVEGRDGKFYMYITVGREIWVGVADAPLGPWRNAREDNQPLIRHKEHYYVETIDAECFIDDDGQAYLYWGSSDSGLDIEGRCLAVKLNDDMVSFSEAPRDVTPPHFFEAPYMLKRDSTYYLMYSWGKTWDKTYQVRYATSDSPYGPWQEGLVRPILVASEKPDRIASTGHHTMLNYMGDDYILYHRFNTMGNYDVAANLRQLAIDKVSFIHGQGIQHVLSTHRGTLPTTTSKVRNLALLADVKSSSDLDSVVRAAFAVDENNGTLWIGSGVDADESLMIDLKSVSPIKRVEIYVEYPIYSYAYKLESSTYGEVWNLLDDQSANTKIGSPMVSNTDVSARFLRITMPNSEERPRPAIWEVKVY